MSLVRIARFHTLSEAQVAASVLRSAGIEPLVSDAHYLGVFWTDTIALGGFRLSVPLQDAQDAVAIIGSPPPVEAEDDWRPQALPGSQRLLSVGLLLMSMLGGGMEGAWLATLRESPRSAMEKVTAALMTVLIVTGALVLLLLGIAYAGEMLFSPP